MAIKAIRLSKRGGGTAAMLLAGAVGMLALPSAVLALSNRFEPDPVTPVTDTPGSTFMPAQVDPRLARSISVRALSKGRTFRFTPAATPSRMDRSVTVAVRLDGNNSRTLVLRPQLAAADAAPGGALRIAPTGYSLGAARGYKSFAQSSGNKADTRKTDIPDLAAFKPSSPGAGGDPSRFSPVIALDERVQSGRSPRTFEQSEQTVDVGGSYRLSRNLKVTAGVRYSSERDRLLPLTDGRQDNQAVYVGTQFRF